VPLMNYGLVPGPLASFPLGTATNAEAKAEAHVANPSACSWPVFGNIPNHSRARPLHDLA
jgi:hypothetical protein